MKLGKKHIVLGALLLALGGSVFLNWQFNDNNALLAATSSQGSVKELGKAQYANATASATEDTSSKDTEPVVMSEESKSYFEEVQKNRNDTQQEIVDMATEILKSTESDDAARTQAVISASQIASVIQKQTNVENLIKAKGFSECMVYIQNDECSVVVNKGVLTEALAVTVRDIVNSQAGIEFDKISITEV